MMAASAAWIAPAATASWPLDPLDLQSLELSARTWLSQVKQKMPASESGRLRDAMSMCPTLKIWRYGSHMSYYVMIRRQFRFNHCWLIYHDTSSFDASSHFGAHGKIALPI